MAVTVYRQVGKGKARRYQKVNLGRGPTDLAGPYFLRSSLAGATLPWEPVSDDLDPAIDAQKRKQGYCDALDANFPVVQNQDGSGRTKITDAVFQWFAELQLFRGKDQRGKSERTLRAYDYRLRFFPTSLLSRTCGTQTRLIATSFCGTSSSSDAVHEEGVSVNTTRIRLAQMLSRRKLKSTPTAAVRHSTHDLLRGSHNNQVTLAFHDLDALPRPRAIFEVLLDNRLTARARIRLDDSTRRRMKERSAARRVILS
jgi:hypothetical protein